MVDPSDPYQHDPLANDHFEKDEYPKGPPGPWYERLISTIVYFVLSLIFRK